ncbi:MAG: hypothetical protein IKN72_10585 [Clostridia bacterium]|nr:hypothetical protein [Clostridia bacterium]
MKKLISLFLSLVLVLLCAVPAGAKKTPSLPEPDYPFLLIRGMDFGGLIYKENTPEEEDAFKGVDVKELVSVILKGIGKGLLRGKVSVFTDDIIAYVTDIIGHVACDENGNTKYAVTIPQYEHAMSYYPEFVDDLGNGAEEGLLKLAVERYGAQNVYYYNYDFRLDPFEHARRIDKLINTALKETGKDKINVVTASMGGILMDSYLYKYGCAKVRRVVFMSSTFNGTYVTTDLLQGNVKVRADDLYAFLKQYIDSGDEKLNGLVDFAWKAGLFKVVEKLAAWFVKHAKEQVYDEFLRDTFGTMPTIWALVQPNEFKACLNYMFGGQEAKYAGIIQKAKAYYRMNVQREAMLKRCVANGMELCICASYDRALVPVYERANVHSDSVLESPLMLGNATVALRGETLPADYVPANPDYLSPDRVVDLSPAMFPELTWAIKGAPHVFCGHDTDCGEFMLWLINQKEQPTVRTSERYPQFMLSSTDQELRLF